MIIVKNIAVYVRNKPIIKELSCTLQPGTINLFIGKSGAGKTTFLRALAGLVPCSCGTIEINERSITTYVAQERARNLGFVFQDFNLFAHMTVLQNCIDPQRIQGIEQTVAIDRANTILASLGLADYKDVYPHNLSGGQQQRVALARTLCLQPNILVLDEPTAALDPENSAILATILRSLASQGLTIVLSTQDMHFAQTIGDTIFFMEQGEIIETADRTTSMMLCPKIDAFLHARKN